MKAILTVGIPGSGKTTKYKNFHGININRDDIRDILFGWPYKFTKAKEQKVTEYANNLIFAAAQAKKDIVISDTNLNEGRRNALVAKLEALGYIVELDVIPCEYEVAVKRDLQRERSVGSNVIWTMFKKFNEQFGIKPVLQDQKLEGCYIFDIDGTIAKMHNRSPFEWDKVEQDLVNIDVWRVASSLCQSHRIIFLSGRDSVCREATLRWLGKAGFEDCELYMRAEGDTRKDFYVKHELYEQHVKPNYKVLGVFDDRPQVCRLWNLLELPLFKVGTQEEF